MKERTAMDYLAFGSAVLVAAITAIGTIIAHRVTANKSYEQIVNAVKEQSAAADAAFDKALSVYAARTDEKIEELSRRVEKHNNVIERTAALEEKIKVANHRIADLERKME